MWVNLKYRFTMRKFQYISVLREMNFGDFRNAKSAIFTTLKALILIFVIFCTFWRHNSRRLTKFRASKVAKIGSFWTSGQVVTTVISRKIFSHRTDLIFFCKIDFSQFAPQCGKTRNVLACTKTWIDFTKNFPKQKSDSI